MTCERLRRDAAGLATLPSGDPEREAAYLHARGCAGCAAALREGERLVALLERLPPEPAPSAALLQRAAAPVLSDLAPAAPPALVPLAAFAAAAIATVGARAHSGSPRDWIAGAALVLGAVALAALSARGVLVAVAAVVASALFAIAGGERGPLEPAEGLVCLATELATAAVPLLVAVALARRGRVSGAGDLAAVAAAGALAGQAALEVTCGAGHAASHVLAFHVGGVLAAALLGALAGLRAGPRAFPA